jgi:hypothetical protein
MGLVCCGLPQCALLAASAWQPLMRPALVCPCSRKAQVLLPRRSMYILSGEARGPPTWKHAIRPVGGDDMPLVRQPAVNPSMTVEPPLAHAALNVHDAAHS